METTEKKLRDYNSNLSLSLGKKLKLKLDEAELNHHKNSESN